MSQVLVVFHDENRLLPPHHAILRPNCAIMNSSMGLFTSKVLLISEVRLATGSAVAIGSKTYD